MEYWLIISVFAVAVAVYAMVDILMTKMQMNRRMLWFAIIVVIPIVGPMIYLLKKKKIVKVS